MSPDVYSFDRLVYEVNPFKKLSNGQCCIMLINSSGWLLFSVFFSAHISFWNEAIKSLHSIAAYNRPINNITICFLTIPNTEFAFPSPNGLCIFNISVFSMIFFQIFMAERSFEHPSSQANPLCS